MNRRARLRAAVLLVIFGTTTCVALSAPPASADTGCPAASSGYGGGSGTSGDPYQISAPGDLQRLRDTSADYARYFLFTQDINMGGCVWSAPISDGSTTFTGRLDGDGHVINGLSVNVANPSLSFVGLVGYLGANGEIRDLGFTGNVSLTDQGSGSSAYVGGLVGFTFAPTTITGSFATGDVSANKTSSGSSVNVWAGGLIGLSQSTVSNSYSTGNVSVSATSTAGSGSDVAITAGGAVGGIGVGPMTNVYATGTVSSTGTADTVSRRMGGFTGTREVSSNLTSLFWNTSSSGLSSATGFGSSTGMNGATTSLMQTASTFTNAGWSLTPGFDATSTWGLCSAASDGLPYLTAFYASSPCIQASDTSQIPPSWLQATGRINGQESCEIGWNPSWAQWMNGGTGGFVCNREVYWDVHASNWSVR